MKKRMVVARSGVIDGILTPPEVIIESAKQYNEEYIPLTDEHDIRKPPIGRVCSAKVVVSDDGTYLLECEAEFFDDNFDLFTKSGKVVNIQGEEEATFSARGNQTFEEDEEIAGLYDELQKLGSGEHGKKYREDSLEPLQVLIIGCGFFVLQGIANGFFSKLGEDLYEKAKLKLKQIFEKRPLPPKEKILQFQFFIKSAIGRTIEVNVVITNPSENDIEGFFYYVPNILDERLSNLPLDELDLCRVVFSYEFTQLKLIYALRSDCIPVSMNILEKDENL